MGNNEGNTRGEAVSLDTLDSASGSGIGYKAQEADISRRSIVSRCVQRHNAVCRNGSGRGRRRVKKASCGKAGAGGGDIQSLSGGEGVALDILNGAGNGSIGHHTQKTDVGRRSIVSRRIERHDAVSGDQSCCGGSRVKKAARSKAGAGGSDIDDLRADNGIVDRLEHRSGVGCSNPNVSTREYPHSFRIGCSEYERTGLGIRNISIVCSIGVGAAVDEKGERVRCRVISDAQFVGGRRSGACIAKSHRYFRAGNSSSDSQGFPCQGIIPSEIRRRIK